MLTTQIVQIKRTGLQAVTEGRTRPRQRRWSLTSRPPTRRPPIGPHPAPSSSIESLRPPRCLNPTWKPTMTKVGPPQSSLSISLPSARSRRLLSRRKAAASSLRAEQAPVRWELRELSQINRTRSRCRPTASEPRRPLQLGGTQWL